jgi:hypothetical protein
LGRRNLYRSTGGDAVGVDISARLWVLNLSDGEHSLLDIAERSGLPFAAQRSPGEQMILDSSPKSRLSATQVIVSFSYSRSDERWRPSFYLCGFTHRLPLIIGGRRTGSSGMCDVTCKLPTDLPSRRRENHTATMRDTNSDGATTHPRVEPA